MKRVLLACILLIPLVVFPVVKYNSNFHLTTQYNQEVSEIQQFYKATVWVGVNNDWVGTGYIQASDDKYTYIVTAAHVINTVRSYFYHGGKAAIGIWDQKQAWSTHEGTILGTRGGPFNSDGDCGLIRIAKVNITPFKLADPAYSSTIGDEVWIGGMSANPNILISTPVAPTTVTVGNVTKMLKDPGNSFGINGWSIEGFSGGPVYDRKIKKVIGVVAWGSDAVTTICPDASTIYELFVSLNLEHLVKEE